MMCACHTLIFSIQNPQIDCSTTSLSISNFTTRDLTSNIFYRFAIFSPSMAPTYDNLQVFTLLSGRVKNLLSTRYTYSAEIFQEFFGMAVPACLLALIKIKVRAPVRPVYSVLFERMKTITPRFLPLAIKRYHINILGFIAIIPCEGGRETAP